MADILKSLMADCKASVPLLMCRKLPSDFKAYNIPKPRHELLLGYDNFARFLEACGNALMQKSPFFVQTYHAALTRLLENEAMGDHRLTGQRYAEACIFWISYLIQDDVSSCKSHEVLEAQCSPPKTVAVPVANDEAVHTT